MKIILNSLMPVHYLFILAETWKVQYNTNDGYKSVNLKIVRIDKSKKQHVITRLCCTGIRLRLVYLISIDSYYWGEKICKIVIKQNKLIANYCEGMSNICSNRLVVLSIFHT